MSASLVVAVLVITPSSASDPVSNALRQAQPVVDRFYTAAKRCEGRLPAKPLVHVEHIAGVTRYEGKRIIIFPRKTSSPATQTALTAHAKAGGVSQNGPGEYGAIFNELLLAHEMGHWVQQSGMFGNRWESEFNANQMMVAFWREHPQGASTRRRLADYLRFSPG